MPQQSTTTEALTNTPLQTGNELITALKSGNGLMLGVCVLGFVALSMLSNGGKKGKLARGRLGNTKEKRSALILALKQIKQRSRNAVALYIGKPKIGLLGKSDQKTLYLPDAQRGIAVCGGPGSGKTFSVVDPAIRSAIDQGFPVILYDFKYPSQTERVVGYAERAGYAIRFFAPGFPESDICNPLDFLRSPSDAETARQMGVVMNKNFKLMALDKEDPFFGPAGDQLVEAIFMAAKSSTYPDVMMCQAILSIEDLVNRIKVAEDLNPWIRASFGQLLSVGKSERTVASIVATANNVFTRFMKPGVLGAFCGKTTLPLDLNGKQLLVLGLDRQRRDVVGPLLATILHMVVNRNVTRRRQDPLILSLDEIPTLYLPALSQWLNENREDGLCSILGFQNIVQLEEAYGKRYKSILGGCATKAIFNPQEYDSAKMFSDFLGEEEIHYTQKSRGRSGGKASTNQSDQERTRKLFEPSQFLKLPTGRCVLISPGYKSKKGGEEEASIPIRQTIKLPDTDIAAIKASCDEWEEIRNEAIINSPQRSPTTADLELRYQAAEQLFSLPPATQPGKAA